MRLVTKLDIHLKPRIQVGNFHFGDKHHLVSIAELIRGEIDDVFGRPGNITSNEGVDSWSERSLKCVIDVRRSRLDNEE